MLLLYYAFIKEKNGTMIITINTIGCAIEGSYLIVYLIYAPKKAKVHIYQFHTTYILYFILSNSVSNISNLVIFWAGLHSQAVRTIQCRVFRVDSSDNHAVRSRYRPT